MSEASDLGADCEAAISRLLESGRFKTRDAVLSQGVDLILQRERAMQSLADTVAASLRDEADGSLVDVDEAFDRMDARLEAAFRSAAAAA
ncbi:hypothetical protein BH09PSE2_BH09PSE2_18320 [soil metagenome]